MLYTGGYSIYCTVDPEIQSIPSFWKHGIRYFNIYGPNGETIEFCQIVEE